MKKPFELREVKPNIFLMNFHNHYDMAMHFLRYQEFYESPSPKFRGKSFSIFDFMRWYSHKYGKGAFTYPVDWVGFNIPSNIIEQVWNLGIPDRNIYDYEMLNVHRTCKEKSKSNFYLIGAVGKNGALKHEIAHGFFYTQPAYKKEMTKLVAKLDPSVKKMMREVLTKMGYAAKVHVDESQAYLSTGLTDDFSGISNFPLVNEIKQFTSVYNKFYKS